MTYVLFPHEGVVEPLWNLLKTQEMQKGSTGKG